MSASEPHAAALGLDEDELRRLRHDLRSPLLVIGGFAQLLAGESVSPEDRRLYADRIHAAAEDMRRMLDDALG